MESHQWTEIEVDPTVVAAMQTAGNLTRATALSLAGRGVTKDTLEAFLRPTLKSMTNPYLLAGTEEAARRLWQAACQRERVLIHGDYDTDGVTAAVLVSQVLAENGVDSEIFLPHRVDDGYGLTVESIEKAGHSKFSLLVSVDCGITSPAAVAEARKQGLEVIITDHHEPGEQLPEECILINPKLSGAPPALRNLAGVGVAFKLCHAFIKYGREHGLGGLQTDLRDYLDLVALGTVADIVPLTDENRCLVRHGLPILARQRRPGIRALCEVAGLNGDQLGTGDIAFRLAPRINAPGRLDDAGLSMALLVATSMAKAAPLAAQVNQSNLLRRQRENEVIALAETQLADSGFNRESACIVVCGQDWHPGVLGIVAARLSRLHHRPAVVLANDHDGNLNGSVRSVPGLNVVEVLQETKSLLERYGGHAMAAGLSLKKEMLNAFRTAFEQNVKRLMSPQAFRPQLHFDGEIELRELSEQFFAERQLLEPFGHGNPEPMFLCRGINPVWTAKAGQAHTRGAVCDHAENTIDFIAFNRVPEELPKPPWNLAIRPQINNFNGTCKSQVEIIDLRSAAP